MRGSEPSADWGIVRVIEESYRLMTLQDQESLRSSQALSRIALGNLVELRRNQGDTAVWLTVKEVSMGGKRLLASQAVTELDLLGYSVEVEGDDEFGEDDEED